VITEGSLGGGLAQRQAALRDVMAAGARSISCLPTTNQAVCVPQKNILWKGRVIRHKANFTSEQKMILRI
jgi:hypothetical protein